MTQIIHVEAKCDEPVASPVVVSKEESPVPEKVGVFAEVEKKSINLLSTFQVYVSDLMKESFEDNMPHQLEKMAQAAQTLRLVIWDSTLNWCFPALISSLMILSPSNAISFS